MINVLCYMCLCPVAPGGGSVPVSLKPVLPPQSLPVTQTPLVPVASTAPQMNSFQVCLTSWKLVQLYRFYNYYIYEIKKELWNEEVNPFIQLGYIHLIKSDSINKRHI